MEKLHWKVKHNVDFSQETDFLETILKSCGVKDIESFLHPSQNFELDPFSLDNMEEGVKLLNENLNNEILIIAD